MVSQQRVSIQNQDCQKGVNRARTTYANRGQMAHVLAALMPTNALVVKLCMATGLRISDVLELRTSELKRRQTVRESKTGKTRRIQWLFPAYAGVIPTQLEYNPIWNTFPRLRGGDPSAEALANRQFHFSPPTRG